MYNYLHGESLQVLLLFVIYLHYQWRTNYQKGMIEIPITCLTPPHFCACPKVGPCYPSIYAEILLFMLNDLRREIVVSFVDIGGIVEHYGLKPSFHNNYYDTLLTTTNK